MIKKIFYIISVVLLGVWVGFWANKTITQIKPSIQITPTSTEIQPTPSNRQLSQIASQSAFFNARDTIASLSASTTGLTINDTTFGPPTIELPLGFDESR